MNGAFRLKTLALAIVPLLLASCSPKLSPAGEQKLCGTFQSIEPMKDGKYFQLQLKSDGSFVEWNYYCTIYGRWYIGTGDVDRFFRLVGERRLMLSMDSIKPYVRLHYDDDEEYLAFRESVYYYCPSDTAVVEFRDRMGERITISHLAFYNEHDSKIYEIYGDTVSLTAVKIPAGTTRFFCFQDHESLTSGDCNNYNTDSGSVCFVMLPHENDKIRIVFLGKNEIAYIPYREYKFFPLLPQALRRISNIRLVRINSKNINN